MAEVHLAEIRKSFGAVEVLKGISLQIASGEFVSLLGASGCGKTTLLRIVAGLEHVSAGQVEIDGRIVTGLPPEQRDISMMFQSYALLPHLSVFENVRFPLRMRGLGNRADQREKVRDALEIVQLAHLADRQPRKLSGGQQQRVALARAIVSRPKVLLLDEPLSNLDARLREEMQVELIEIHKRLGLTTIFVTHDQEEALSLSDRVVLLNAGQIEQEGTPDEIYTQPRTAYASSFLGAANLLPATVADGPEGPVARLADGQMLQIGAEIRERGPVALSIRQEDLALVPSDEGQLTARLRTHIYLGARSRYILRLADTQIAVLAPNDVDAGGTGEVGLRIDPSLVRILPPAEEIK